MAKKLIARRTDDGDRRAVRVDLTPRGRQLVEELMNRRRRHIDEVLSRMSPEAHRRVARALGEFAPAAGELSDAAWTLGWSDETLAVGGQNS